MNDENLGEETLRILRERGVFDELTVKQAALLAHVNKGKAVSFFWPEGSLQDAAYLETQQLIVFNSPFYQITDKGKLALFYDVWVWLKDHEEDKQKVIIESSPPLNPMTVKGWCCVKGIFSWKEYQRIRYRRVTRREEKR